MCVRALVCAHQKRLAAMKGGGPCALTAVLGGTALFPDMPSKGPCCNSNIIAIRFVGLNCQERMISMTRQEAIKSKHAADCSWRFFFFFGSCWGKAALVTMQRRKLRVGLERN